MTQHETDSLAAEYVLGTLDGDARARFQLQLPKEPALRQAVTAWEERLSVLSAEETPVAPAANLWQRIAPALDGLDAPAQNTTIRADEGEWETVIEGVFKKRLFVDPEEGTQSFLLRFAPGARYPAHSHGMAEECLMLEGEVTIGDLHLSAGDFNLAHVGSEHSELVSETGALVYVRGALSAA